MPSSYTEDRLVEQPAIVLFGELGWDTANCFYETFGPTGTLGRETSYDVVLERRLRPALKKLNSDLPEGALRLAVEELTKDRGLMSPAQANREVYRLLKNGVKVPGLGEKDDELRAVERRQDEVREALAALDTGTINPDELRGALENLEPVWEELFPAERKRVLTLLLERVEFDAIEGEVAITFRPGAPGGLTR